MDIDHEAHKHDVPPSTVKGEAERTAAEDPSEQIQDVLDDARDAVGQDADAAEGNRAGEPGGDGRESQGRQNHRRAGLSPRTKKPRTS